jgi:hypothetical protein
VTLDTLGQELTSKFIYHYKRSSLAILLNFIEGAGLIFKSKKNSLDYHSEMNAETFEEWLQDKLLPALAEPSIVLDNASYHSRLEEKKPTCAWRKAHLQTWLQNNNIHFSETDKKDTLLKLCRQNYKSPVYVVDRVIHEAGHKPLGTFASISLYF